MARLVDIDNEKFWNILFDEACVEGNQAVRIEKELNKIANDGWIPVSERLPEEEGQGYIVQRTDGTIDILGFTKDAYKLDRYDFAEYKGKKKPIFYDFDSEYGYCECGCVAWQPLPAPFKPKGE
jgi:hypothetical protein